MTQMNVVTTASTSASQCFSQTNSDCSPESGNDSMVGSVESVRDRSHLFLDVGSKRGRGLLNGIKRNLNGIAITTTIANGVNHANPTVSTTATINNGFGTIDGISPMLPKDFLQIVNAVMSPANRRGSFPLPKSLAQSALGNQLVKSGLAPQNFIAETPTPTKILYPKQITQEQQEFVDGFNKALEEIQTRNQFNANNLSSPTNSSLLIPLLAALTPTIPNQTLSSVQNTSSITNALIAALTPTSTQNQTVEQIFAAFASITGTPTGVSPTTNLPVQTNKTDVVNPVVTVPNTASAFYPTSVSTTVSTSNLMDNMFSTHPDFNNFMNHFNQNVMPPHSQPLSTHNGISYHQQNMQIPSQVPLNVKIEPGTNNYNGMCQPPPQMCPPSTSHPGSNYSMPHSVGSTNDEFRMDMTEQERRKLERKRARNRMAASKCRQRKIERIQQLETEVQQEHQRYVNLQQSISSLEKTIALLQNELSRHKNAGCLLEKTTLHLMSHLNNLVNSNVNMGIDTI